ncbi:MAG: DUF5946 family protein [Anaerolineales bacterium]
MAYNCRMASICPQCGGLFPDGESCQARFDLSQATEAEQPAYYAVHHLSVPAYWLQHNRYSREGWLFSRALLDQFVHHGLTPAQARLQNRQALDSGQRAFSFARGPKLAGVENITWTVTLAGVPLDSAERYCAGVRRWAQGVLADSLPLINSQPR